MGMNEGDIATKVPNGGLLMLRITDVASSAAILERLVFLRPPKTSTPDFEVTTDKKNY
jgi:hypothetical protein